MNFSLLLFVIYFYSSDFESRALHSKTSKSTKPICLLEAKRSRFAFTYILALILNELNLICWCNFSLVIFIKGFGVVEFTDAADAEKAVEKMHRYEINGRQLVVRLDDSKGGQREKYNNNVRDNVGGGGGGGGGSRNTGGRDLHDDIRYPLVSFLFSSTKYIPFQIVPKPMMMILE